MENNTNPNFFALWTKKDLQAECARLNKVLKEINELAGEMLDEKN